MFGKEDNKYINRYELEKQYYSSLLKLNRQDLVRKNFVMAASVLYAVVFVSFAVMQSGVINFSRNQLTFFANLMDYLALFLCLIFLVAGLLNVLYLEKEKRKLNEKLRELNNEQSEQKMLSDKVANFCDMHGNKFDLAGTFCTTIMQAVVIFSLTIPSIFDVSKFPAGTAFNLQGIIDTVGNILFTVAAGMFLLSHILKYKKNKDNNKSNVLQSLVISGIFFGTFLIFAGKVLLSFEVKQGPMYTGNAGPFGMDSLPLALIMRSVGMVIFCIAYALVLYNSIKENQDLSKKLCDKVGSEIDTGSVDHIYPTCKEPLIDY